MNTIRKFTDRKVRVLAAAIFFIASLIFDLIFMFSPVVYSGNSVWMSAKLWVNNLNFAPSICLIYIILFCVNAIISAIDSIISAFDKTSRLWPCAVVFFSHILIIALNSAFDVLKSPWAVIVSTVFAFFGFVYGILCQLVDGKKSDASSSRLKKSLTAVAVISALPVLSLFYVPLCTYAVNNLVYSVVPMGAFSSGADNMISLSFFVLVVIATAVEAMRLFGVICFYGAEDSVYGDKVNRLVHMGTVITGLYFLSGVVLCSLNNSKGGSYTATCFAPFIISLILSLVCAFLTRKTVKLSAQSKEKGTLAARIEFFIYATLVSAITIASSLSDIITVTFLNVPVLHNIRLNGYDIFMTYNSLESGLQLIAFLLFVIVVVTVGLLTVSLLTLISGSKLFFKITLGEIVSGAFFSLLIGLFGKYYEIVQRLNEDVIRSLIEGISGSTVGVFEYRVQGQSFYWFIAAMIVIAVAVIRKPYSKGTMGETPVMVANGSAFGSASVPSSGSQRKALNVTDDVAFSDPCPAFTEIDGKQDAFKADTQSRMTLQFKNPTLPTLVQFVVNYARDCRLHLSYTPEDIATFIAGLGATRLTILQGMSGTGKTSLPKIFAEAVLGNCEIIEVESSWRDKNELLGYYNEFSKTYTPKKFTQALYKAGLNPDTVTFIVLDEMNLSRIEYYFSDFLSLMENEEDKREIKLLNVPLYRTENGVPDSYAGLTDGHTVKIPSNIWFIGTANRDESTFEISDKVYDRAHTMNFNKRASKPLAYGEPIPQRYLTVDDFSQLLKNAKTSVRFDIDQYPLIREVEQLLAPYNISFGNRIANQIETFVSIYCACFPSPEAVAFDAVEKILLSKVVSKLEFKSVENKARLAAEFEKRKLHRCSEFILRLNED